MYEAPLSESNYNFLYKQTSTIKSQVSENKNNILLGQFR